MVSKAQKLKAHRSNRAGRPRKEGLPRHPCGKLVQKDAQAETERQTLEVGKLARMKHHGFEDNGSLSGYTLGRIFLDKEIERHHLDAGNYYAECVSRYHRLVGIPSPSARAQQLFVIAGYDGDPSDELQKKARRASNKFMELEGILLRCEDGPQVKATVWNVCVMDYDHLRGMPAQQKLWLKRGLAAIHAGQGLAKDRQIA